MFDVFISYHGGQGDENRSSYSKAEELYDFLLKRNLKPFIYKKQSEVDFYDSIDKAIFNSRHFILVACDKDMLSEWVRDEVKQFDALRKNNRKPNSILSAYIFGDITIEDLYSFNTVFATKDIASGENGFEKLYSLICAEDSKMRGENMAMLAADKLDKIYNNFDDISKEFLHPSLKNYQDFDDNDFEKECSIITRRLKCMSTVTVPVECDNIIKLYYNDILNISKTSNNIMQISGQSGTQKSYVLQLLYVCLRLNMSEHTFDPIYVNCDSVREKLIKKNNPNFNLNDYFKNIVKDNDRKALFIIDGVSNVVIDNYRIDFNLKKIADHFENVCFIVGRNIVFNDNLIRLNKSFFARGNFVKNLNLTPVSLYDREKCIEYINTIEDLLIDYPDIDSAEKVFEILSGSGLITVDEHIIRVMCAAYNGIKKPRIMEVFEEQLLNYLDGDEELLNDDAKLIFDFAYGSNNDFDFVSKTNLEILYFISREQIYLNCLIAIHYINKLSEFEYSHDFKFFEMVFPKEITRFIIQKVNSYSKYEDLIIKLAEHYNEMNAFGKSEMSFFLGRLKNTNQRMQAENILHDLYKRTQQEITKKIIDDQYNGIKYTYDSHKQDLFLLRGISVSLIYSGDKTVLYDYIRSLIDDDLSNLINRGFHLEYYGDIRYLPNQNTLKYEDDVRLGEKTLNILCNSVEKQYNNRAFHHAVLLEMFTIVSILQMRIETQKSQFNIEFYVKKCIDLIPLALQVIDCEDDIIKSFFMMTINDFKKYIQDGSREFDPKREICNEYLNAMFVKRTGWVMQGIPGPESIVEHMYCCWFIGLIFLPNEIDNEHYNKQEILNMLLIHDLAETKLDDIPKYEKYKYPNYELEENNEMLYMLLKGTYGEVDAMTQYVNAWRNWYKRDDINALIAKDIDTIQAVYQFLIYYKLYPEKFDEERKNNWIKELNCIKTEIGQNIVNELIINNDKVNAILKK